MTAQTARMLRFLGLVTGPELAAAHVATLAGTTVFEAEEALEELVEAGLLRRSFTSR
nr:hypothetical protein [Streptomyces hygroscopicus]